MSRAALLVGIPRSGTTWMSGILAAHPSVTFVHEPDNPDVHDVAWWLSTEYPPSLQEGERDAAYEALFRLAFRGGWPQRGVGAWSTYGLHRASASHRLPLWVRHTALTSASRIATPRSESNVMLVKSVAAYLSVEWFAERFDPAIIVVWRHPLNVVASWIELGWLRADFASRLRPVRERFETTNVWPPPQDEVAGTAWSVCAASVVLLESAARVSGTLVLGHEQGALDPNLAAQRMLDFLGLPWRREMENAIEAFNQPGEGWAPYRRAEEQSHRWRTRLDVETRRATEALIERFARESPVAAALWESSPAIAD